MENATGQVIDADEIERCKHVDSCNEHALADYELSKSVDFCHIEANRITDIAIEHSSINGNVVEPFLGMEFKSRDDAYEFYATYGRRTGFTIRIHHNRRSRVNNLVIGQDFVCSKEGFREKKYVSRKDRILPPPPVTREGCPAMLRVALRDGVKWVATKFVKQHNHPLMSPSKIPWRGFVKHTITEDEKDQRIRELTLELYNERQKCKRRCAVYREQLLAVLKDVDEYNEHVSKRVKDIAQLVTEAEKEEAASSVAG
ncbi:hypothetical protein V2J09_002200 [Rumex salicifolius]